MRTLCFNCGLPLTNGHWLTGEVTEEVEDYPGVPGEERTRYVEFYLCQDYANARNKRKKIRQPRQ